MEITFYVSSQRSWRTLDVSYFSDPRTCYFVVLASYIKSAFVYACFFFLYAYVSSWLLVLIRLSFRKARERATHKPSPGNKQSIVSLNFLFITAWDIWAWVCSCHSPKAESKLWESALSFHSGFQKSNAGHWACTAVAFTHSAVLPAPKQCFFLECCLGTNPRVVVESRP